jgi:segregation and condensation protein B
MQDDQQPGGLEPVTAEPAQVIDQAKLRQIIEAALLAADEPLSLERLARLFAHGELDSEEGRAQLRSALEELEADTVGRGYELVRVASGYRFQVRQELSEWIGRLWEERVVGEREAPGRPSLYGTTRAFLDYFNLRSLDQLPPLPEIRALLEDAVAANATPALTEAQDPPETTSPDRDDPGSDLS